MSLLRRLQRRNRSETRRQVERGQSEMSFDEDHSTTYLKDKVTSMDSKPETIRGGSEYLHGSSLVGLCSRKEVLASLTNEERSTSVHPSMRIVWALGRAAENHVRSQFVEARKREGIIGSWSCRCGHTKHEGLYNHQLRCERCRTRVRFYGELTLWDHDAKIVGNPDLLYARPDDYKIRVVEIKSINKREFDALTGPKPDHVYQAMIYRRLLQLNGMEADEEAVTIFYVCKDFAFASPYKEFHVQVTEETENVLDDMWLKAATIRDWKQARIAGQELPLPDRLGVCSSATATTAKNCTECVSCFART